PPPAEQVRATGEQVRPAAPVRPRGPRSAARRKDAPATDPAAAETKERLP
ncbi:cell wall anchor protein, partial [Actinomadura logoneensis]